jgi:hypothetical protein
VLAEVVQGGLPLGEVVHALDGIATGLHGTCCGSDDVSQADLLPVEDASSFQVLEGGPAGWIRVESTFSCHCIVLVGMFCIIIADWRGKNLVDVR